MAEKDNSIQKFDPQVLKRNLDTLRTDNHLNQAELGEIAGIAQPQVSEKLSFKNKNIINVEQLANIAMYFNVSTDDLLGIKPTKKSDEDITLTDIFQRLFEIDKMVGLKIVHHVVRDPEIPEADIDECLMYFDNDILTQKLAEWEWLQNSDSDYRIKNRLLNVWKEDVLEEGTSRRKSDNFHKRLIPP